MSKSLIRVVQGSIIEVQDGSVLPLGTTIHRFGQNIRQDGNTVSVRNRCDPCGYYDINAIVNLEGAAAGPITVSIQKNGVDQLGGSTTITVPAATLVPFPVSSTVKLDGKGATASISLVVKGGDVKVVSQTLSVIKG